MRFKRSMKYTEAVKVTNWQDQYEYYPFDNPDAERTGASHYRTFGVNNESIVPKSTMKEFYLPRSTYREAERGPVGRDQVNFISFPMTDYLFNTFDRYEIITSNYVPKTIYQTSFLAHKPLKERTCCESVPDPLLNRTPKNAFEYLPSSENKCMDDHIARVGENRKKINFLRQMRGQIGMEYYKPFKYGLGVRQSSWQHRDESFPFDCPRKYYGDAHYRTFGLTDKVEIPETTTQELYHSGTTQKITERQVCRNIVTFLTYPIHSVRFDGIDYQRDQPQEVQVTSHYQDDFKPPKPYKHKINCCIAEPDPLMNRKPKNDFEFTPASPYKFMDDNFANLPENRKKVNFLRQIRLRSRVFE